MKPRQRTPHTLLGKQLQPFFMFGEKGESFYIPQSKDNKGMHVYASRYGRTITYEIVLVIKGAYKAQGQHRLAMINKKHEAMNVTTLFKITLTNEVNRLS